MPKKKGKVTPCLILSYMSHVTCISIGGGGGALLVVGTAISACKMESKVKVSQKSVKD